MGVTRQSINPYEPRNGDSSGPMMAMSTHADADEAPRRTVMGRMTRPRPVHGQTMDEDRQEGVGLHSSHVDALMRGEFRAGRGRGKAEGFAEAAAEWPSAWENGWHQGAAEGEDYVLGHVRPEVGKLIADVKAAREGFKRQTDKKTTKGQLHDELRTVAERLDALDAHIVALAGDLTGE